MILKEEGGKKKILITRLNRARDRKNYFGKSTSFGRLDYPARLFRETIRNNVYINVQRSEYYCLKIGIKMSTLSLGAWPRSGMPPNMFLAAEFSDKSAPRRGTREICVTFIVDQSSVDNNP